MITENIPILKIHKLSQDQYKRELESGNIEALAMYLTPDDDVIKSGSGKSSIIIGDKANATGGYSIAGGTNDSDVIKNIIGYDITSIPDSLIESYLGSEYISLKEEIQKPNTSSGDISIALGMGAQALTAGEFALGIAANAGCRGVYWFTIDFANNQIQLTTTQKRYSDGIFGLGANKTPVWDTNAASQISQWVVGDMISINNGIETYVNSIKISAIDATNGIITVESLPFTETDTTSLTITPVHYGVSCPTKPSAGIADLAFAGVSIGLNTKASGTFARAYGKMTLAAGNYSTAEGAETQSLGSVSHAEGNKTVASGDYSHAEGNKTEAIGHKSHAEGNYTDSTGENSHSEGMYVIAGGVSSHAEGMGYGSSTGMRSRAEGDASHVEGYYTRATGLGAHAEGGGDTVNKHPLLASGDYSHAEGYCTTARGNSQHVQGRWNIIDYKKSSLTNEYVDDEGNIVETAAESGTAYAHIIGNGTDKDNRKNIHTVDWFGNAWFAGNITIGSDIISKVATETYVGNYMNSNYITAGKKSSSSIGSRATAEGYSNTASGAYSHAEGYQTSAQGTGAHAEGNNTVAIGAYSHAEGYQTYANKDYSHAEGYQTYANKTYSHAEGYQTSAQGTGAHAEGYQTSAQGTGAHAEGRYSIAVTESSHAEGRLTNAFGEGAHAEGHSTYAIGNFSHAEGYSKQTTTVKLSGDIGAKTYVLSSPNSSIKINKFIDYTYTYNNTKTRVFRRIISYDTNGTSATITLDATLNPYEALSSTEVELIHSAAYKEYSHVEGNLNTAIGSYSHAEGSNTIAIGNYSHSEGYNTIAQAIGSHAEGYCTTARGNNQHVQGQYNINDTGTNSITPNGLGKYAHIVGNGTGEDEYDDEGNLVKQNRSNAHTIDWEGNAWFAGMIQAAGLNQVKVHTWKNAKDESISHTFERNGTGVYLVVAKLMLESFVAIVTAQNIDDTINLKQTVLTTNNETDTILAVCDNDTSITFTFPQSSVGYVMCLNGDSIAEGVDKYDNTN